ncbi:hypothetical protein [Methylobacter sp. S3L5C]|uniref:hypothetical protein n=1 Tax=Methylobacter sp. S3L5C TaxID=2839024 RepID=UPI001FAB88D4|nr:hypothetical protein [Methylobacter sp. S3L5C]UOA08353.1 hypothetical protein KKZ03_19455 [Methylobacter sp. S3L5C]
MTQLYAKIKKAVNILTKITPKSLTVKPSFYRLKLTFLSPHQGCQVTIMSKVAKEVNIR